MHVKLIEGTFSPAEAREVLLSLVQSKIDYHSLKLASDSERFGHDVACSERRIEELKQVAQSLKEFLSDAGPSGHTLAVDGRIEIAALSPKPAQPLASGRQ